MKISSILLAARDVKYKPLTRRDVKRLRVLCCAGDLSVAACVLGLRYDSFRRYLYGDLYLRIGVRSKAQAVAWAMREGIDD